MKSKLYRVLVMLLAIAMMIPSFALAEEAAKTPSIKIEGTETTFKKEVLSTEIGSQVSTGLKYTVADVPETALSTRVEWAPDATKVVTVPKTSDGTNGTHDLPNITLKAYEGTAKLTGTLYVNEKPVGTPVVVTVTLTSKDVEKIAFKKAAYEVLLTNKSKSFKDEVEVTPAEWWTTTSISQDAIDWSIPEGKGDDIARVDVNGNVTFVKAGTVTLQASLDGSKVAAATTTLTIIDNEQDPEDPEPAEGYTKLQFTAKNFALPYSSTAIDLMDPQYLSVRFVGDTTTDSLVWEVDKPQIATITYGVTDDAEPVPFARIKFDTLFGEENKVHVTVHSSINPTIKSECDVWMLPDKETEKIEKIEFNPASVTVREGQTVNALDYIKVTPAKLQYMSAWLTWSSNDESVATVEDDGTITAEGEGDAVITAGQYGDVVGKFNVKVVKKATNPVKTLKFSETELEIREGSSNQIGKDLAALLIKDPTNTDDTLIWTSDDTTVVDVDSYGNAYIKQNAKAGMSAKISVRNIDDTVKVETPLTIKIVKAPSKPVTALKFSQDELIVKKSASAMSLKSLYLVPTPTDSDEKLVWTSSDSSVVMVDKTTGYASFNNIGETTINVRNEDNTVSTKKGLVIKVVKDKDAYTEITPTEKSVKISSSINLDAYITTKGNIAGLDELVWTSSNQQILSFPTENSGATKLNPNKIGKVTVTVRNKVEPIIKCTFEVEVTDNRKPIQKIELTQDTFELEPSGTLYLDRYVVTDPVEHNDTLFYTSDDPSVAIQNNTASVDANLLEDGEAHITVRSTLNPDVSAKFTLKLKGKGVTSIAFKDAPKTFYKEMKTLDLRDYLVTKPADYVEKHSGNLVWESSDPTVALAYNEQPWVDNVTKTVYGCLTYVQPGNVTITVTDKVSGKSAKVDLVLKEKHPVESITLKDITMDYEDRIQVLENFLTYAPLNASFSTNNITWTSSNRDVAEVIDFDEELPEDSNYRDNTRGPILVAYKAGTTKITAYYELEDGKVLKATATVTVNDVELEKVKIAEDKYILKLNTKKTATVRFNVEPFNCSFEEDDLYVISTRSDVVEVTNFSTDSDSHKGKINIEAKKPGTAWIVVKRASDDKALDSCKIKVKAVAVKSVKWDKSSVKMYYYDDGVDEVGPIPVKVVDNKIYRNVLRVKPIINPDKAYCNVSFETSDPSVAFINDESVVDFLNGEYYYVNLVCVGPGNCKITMKVDDGKKVRKAVLKVEVQTKLPKMKMSQSKATLKLEKGADTLQLRAYDANTDTDMDVKWASSNKKVVKVNAEGKVRAIAAGTATITATTKNGQKQVVKCKITVKAPSTKNEATKITGDTKVTVKAGEKKALEIKVKPEGAKVTFTSSDSKIVKVTKDGTIKGIKAGKATITVKAAEGKAELKIKVVVK